MDTVAPLARCRQGLINEGYVGAEPLYTAYRPGCGDANWPKSLLYVAGWGTGLAALNDEVLYRDYQIHFMVTQGMRDRKTFRVTPSPTAPGLAGSVNPAATQLDFYIRSPETNDANHPQRQVFDHVFATEVTWR